MADYLLETEKSRFLLLKELLRHSTMRCSHLTRVFESNRAVIYEWTRLQCFVQTET